MHSTCVIAALTFLGPYCACSGAIGGCDLPWKRVWTCGKLVRSEALRAEGVLMRGMSKSNGVVQAQQLSWVDRFDEFSSWSEIVEV